jgi:hypothetical protein
LLNPGKTEVLRQSYPPRKMFGPSYLVTALPIF